MKFIFRLLFFVAIFAAPVMSAAQQTGGVELSSSAAGVGLPVRPAAFQKEGKLPAGHGLVPAASFRQHAADGIKARKTLPGADLPGLLSDNAKTNRGRDHAACPWRDASRLAENLVHGFGSVRRYNSQRFYGSAAIAEEARAFAAETLSGVEGAEVVASAVSVRNAAGFGFTLNYRYRRELRFYFSPLAMTGNAAAGNGLNFQLNLLRGRGAVVLTSATRRFSDGHFAFLIVYIPKGL